MDKNPLDALRELAEDRHSLVFTTAELTILSTALEGMGLEITKRMSGASPEQVRAYAVMLSDAKTLENRIDTLLKSLLSEKLADFLPTTEEDQ